MLGLAAAVALAAMGGFMHDDLDLDEARPQTRADCRNASRPCPFVGCRFHLALNITAGGTIQAPTTMARSLPQHASRGAFARWSDELVHHLAHLGESCALDIAERGGTTLEAIGEAIGLTAERVHALEVAALEGARRLPAARGARELAVAVAARRDRAQVTHGSAVEAGELTELRRALDRFIARRSSEAGRGKHV